MNNLILCLLIILLPFKIFASEEKLPLPRFASIKSNEVTVRAGPGSAHKVLWIFVKKNEPVEIVEEFDNWRKIRDYEGQTGWVHSRMLIGKRHCIINKHVHKDTKDNTKLLNKKGKVNDLNIETLDVMEKISNDGFALVYRSNNKDSKVVAHAYDGLRCRIVKIEEQWCKIDCDKAQGWVEKTNLWGIYDSEIK